MALVDEAVERVKARTEAAIVDELADAALTFAREHPDVPRASQAVPA